MKYLALALLLCALASLSNAQCYRKPMTPGLTHCQDDVDKTWHEMGSSWRNSKCMDCDCDGCCAGYSTPRSFPDDCVSVFDSQACQYIVHKRDDPTVHCQIFGSVGK
ncbi:beta-microseminoprotein-like [Anoplopoma fimbria]|uniref:beta-microseminoprotein-like n=1 Tax=Anoplopoma fimbria TaxID=229290 RepID=UPI0023EBC691|nr:beta-microseminoprotein-like [Anoplopoma fimbria]